VHEIKNPVALINGLSEQLQDGELPPAMVEKIGGKIEKASLKILEIVKSVQSLVHGQSAEMTVNNIDGIVEEAVEFSTRKANKLGVEIQCEDIPDVEILCRPIQITQVISNLINNGADAVSELDERWVRVEAKEDGANVIVSVTDSGKIDADLAKKIFTPLFTTKEKGKGTGLGLYLADQIISEHKGKVEIDTTAPNTKFVITLPKK
jgi:signal transduction histidine kinase